MPIYKNSEQLYLSLKTLFGRIQNQYPDAVQTVKQARLIIRFKTSFPQGEVLINGRKYPVEITYGASSLRADLDVELSADALHYILLDELSLKKALSSRQMKVRGPVLKSFVLEEIFRRGQALYPQVLEEGGFIKE